MIALEKKHKKAIDSVILQYPYRFFVYGSRVKGSYKDYSDLDFCIFDDIDIWVLAEIKEKLNNILLPFSVDVLSWKRLSAEFQSLIASDLTPYLPDLFLQAEVLDLSHHISKNSPAWPGNTFELIQESTPDQLFCIQKYSFSAGFSTHIDSPKHIVKNGLDLANLSLSTLIAPCSIYFNQDDVSSNFQLTLEMLKELESKNGPIAQGTWLLIMTGWGKYWHDSKSYQNMDEHGVMHFPTISLDAAEYLVEKKIAGIGIDTLSPDKSDSSQIHELLLKNNILIVENLKYIDQANDYNGFVQVIPLAIEGGAESPARVLFIQQK